MFEGQGLNQIVMMCGGRERDVSLFSLNAARPWMMWTQTVNFLTDTKLPGRWCLNLMFMQVFIFVQYIHVGVILDPL